MDSIMIYVNDFESQKIIGAYYIWLFFLLILAGAAWESFLVDFWKDENNK